MAPANAPRDGAPRKKGRLFKIGLIIILFLLVLFVAAIYFLPYFLPVDTIRKQAKDQVKAATGMDFDFAKLSLSWTGGVVLEGITLAPPPAEGAAAKPLLSVDSLKVEVAWKPLLSGRVVVQDVLVNGFAVRLAKNEKGEWNLPVLPAAEPAPAATAAVDTAARPMLAAAQEAPAQQKTLPVEVHQVRLEKGVLGVDDPAQNLKAEVEVVAIRINGSDLNSPFEITGKINLLPSAPSPDEGMVELAGSASLLKDDAFNPDGSAAMEIRFPSLNLPALAKVAGLGDMVPAGTLRGKLTGKYQAGKVGLDVAELDVKGLEAALEGMPKLTLPDSSVKAAIAFDPASGRLQIDDFAFENSIKSAKGRGWVANVGDFASGTVPASELDFSGAADIAKAVAFLEGQGLVPKLPALAGAVEFAGKAVVAPAAGGTASPITLAVNIAKGELATTNGDPLPAKVDFSGLALQASVAQGQADPAIDASIAFKGLGVEATPPGFASAVAASLNGGAVFSSGGGKTPVAEIRLDTSEATLPESDYAHATRLTNIAAKAILDVAKDSLTVSQASFALGDAVAGGVRSGTVTGILAGDPKGTAELEFSCSLDKAAALMAGKTLPAGLQEPAGTAKGLLKVALAGGGADLNLSFEGDGLKALLSAPEGTLRFDNPKVAVAALARLNLANPFGNIAFSADVGSNGGAVNVRTPDNKGYGLGYGGIKAVAAGFLDLSAMRLSVSTIGMRSGGVRLRLSEGSAVTAEAETGLIGIDAKTSESALLSAPLTGAGAFAVPVTTINVDKLVFRRATETGADENNLGVIRLILEAEGILPGGPGTEKPNIVVKQVSLATAPVQAQAVAAVDPVSGGMSLRYTARVLPSQMQALLSYLQVPTTLFGDNAVTSGTMSWNGVELVTEGKSSGNLSFNTGEVDPFSMEHDFTLSYSEAAKTIKVDMRKLAGVVANNAKQPIISIQAQPSTILVSETSANGNLDISLYGSASATRMLALGVTSAVPQLRDYASILHGMLVDGVYEAWVKVRGQDGKAVDLNAGGNWKGAALKMSDGGAMLAEPDNLAFAVEGTFEFAQRLATLRKLEFNSASAPASVRGVAQVSLAAPGAAEALPIGQLMAELVFSAPDLARLAQVFPGVVPADLGLAGKVDGHFKASGQAQAIKLENGVVQFAGFRGQPGGMSLQIPTGNATFAGTFSVNPPVPAQPNNPYEALLLFNVAGGSLTVSGAQLEGRAINNLQATYKLTNGVFDLDSFQAALAGQNTGTAQARARVDFTHPAPAVSAQFGLVNIPLAELTRDMDEFLTITEGTVNLPSAAGQSASVSFTGFSEAEILRTLKTENLDFATGRVVVNTGPKLNEELDKASKLLKIQSENTGKARIVNITSITGYASADGSGVVTIPQDRMIKVVGENTGDFGVTGVVRADRTLDLDGFVLGKLENLVGFSIPNIIPGILNQSAEDQSRYMDKLNQYAAAGHYKVKVSGSFDNVAVSGIPEFVTTLIADLVKASPAAVIGGVIDIGKNAPETIKNLPSNVIKLPGDVIKAPVNIGKGIGNLLGGRQGTESANEQQGQAAPEPQAAPQPQGQPAPQQNSRQQSVQDLFNMLQPEQNQGQPAQPQSGQGQVQPSQGTQAAPQAGQPMAEEEQRRQGVQNLFRALQQSRNEQN